MSWILCRELLASIAKCWFGYGATIGMAYESHNWICRTGFDFLVLWPSVNVDQAVASHVAIIFGRICTRRLCAFTMDQTTNRSPQPPRQTSKASELLKQNTQEESPKKGHPLINPSTKPNIHLTRRFQGVSQSNTTNHHPTPHSASTNRLANRPKTGTSNRSSISTTTTSAQLIPKPRNAPPHLPSR